VSEGGAEANSQEHDVLSLLDEVRAIARTGLHYSENPFDRARYERLLEIASDEYAARTSLSPAAVRARFDAEIGYQTARVGVDAAVFDADDRILLVRRVDDDKWGLVAGWVDPNEAPEHTAVREMREEVGLDARVDALAGVFFRPAHIDEHPHGTVSIVYLCSITGGTPRPQPHEVRDIAYRAIEDVAPDEWHHHHAMLAHAARDAYWRRRTGV
jgi:ADP-ribose pyrophosphatase YjhB (NUDIX family)